LDLKSSSKTAVPAEEPGEGVADGEGEGDDDGEGELVE
jgi:hypothetical protein